MKRSGRRKITEKTAYLNNCQSSLTAPMKSLDNWPVTELISARENVVRGKALPTRMEAYYASLSKIEG